MGDGPLYHQRFIGCPARGDGHTCDGIPGDCLRTAVAVTVGAAPWTLTHYAQRVDWWGAMRTEARERWGQDWACLSLDDEPLRQGMAGGWHFPPGRHLVVASGPSPRGPFGHVCVYALTATEDSEELTLEHVHDPHPLGMGLEHVRELLVPVGIRPSDPAPVVLAIAGPRQVECGGCGGTGNISDVPGCPDCHGTGRVLGAGRG